MAEALLVVAAHLVAGLEQVRRHHQEVVEVKRIRRQQPLLVLGIDVGDLALEGVGSLAGGFAEGLEVDQLGLGLPDDGGDRAGGEALRIEPHLGHDHLDEPPRVRVVVDREGRPVTETVGVAAQNAQA